MNKREKLTEFALEFFKAGMDVQEIGMPSFDQIMQTNYYKGKIDEILALPLDVPSDEEIEKYCYKENHGNTRMGAKWMREEIIKRNK